MARTSQGRASAALTIQWMGAWMTRNPRQSPTPRAPRRGPTPPALGTPGRGGRHRGPTGTTTRTCLLPSAPYGPQPSRNCLRTLRCRSDVLRVVKTHPGFRRACLGPVLWPNPGTGPCHRLALPQGPSGPARGIQR